VDFTEARDSEWQWHQLGHMQVCTSLQTDNYANTSPLSFFTGRMPFLPPSQQRHYSNLALTVLNRRQFQGRLISPITARNSPKSNIIWSRQRETTVLGLLIHEKHSQVVPRHPQASSRTPWTTDIMAQKASHSTNINCFRQWNCALWSCQMCWNVMHHYKIVTNLTNHTIPQLKLHNAKLKEATQYNMITIYNNNKHTSKYSKSAHLSQGFKIHGYVRLTLLLHLTYGGCHT